MAVTALAAVCVGTERCDLIQNFLSLANVQRILSCFSGCEGGQV